MIEFLFHEAKNPSFSKFLSSSLQPINSDRMTASIFAVIEIFLSAREASVLQVESSQKEDEDDTFLTVF